MSKVKVGLYYEDIDVPETPEELLTQWTQIYISPPPSLAKESAEGLVLDHQGGVFTALAWEHDRDAFTLSTSFEIEYEDLFMALLEIARSEKE